MENINNKVIIECSCGTHLLSVENNVEFFDDTVSKKTRVFQEYDFAMFNYGIKSHKAKFWRRLGIAFNYIRTGQMHADQITLTPDEAKKFTTFINDTLVPTEE